MMKLFYLILYKCRKLRLHLVNSKLILFEEKIHLIHLRGLILKGGQPFWIPQPDLCPLHSIHPHCIVLKKKGRSLNP
jgi:hypothetical protein